MPIGTTIGIAAAAAIVSALVVDQAHRRTDRKAVEVEQAKAAQEEARTAALVDIAAAGTEQSKAMVELTDAVQGLESMRADLRADLAGASGLPVACLEVDHSLKPACMAVKCWQFQQSDAGRSSTTECVEWSRLARAQAANGTVVSP